MTSNYITIRIGRKIIRNSTKERWLVLKPFVWSFTTAVTCEKNNRRRIYIENNPEYFKTGKKRIKNI